MPIALPVSGARAAWRGPNMHPFSVGAVNAQDLDWVAGRRAEPMRQTGVELCDLAWPHRDVVLAEDQAHLTRRGARAGAGAGWLYLAAVVDCFSRRVVGWSMRDDLRAELVVDALEMAVARQSALDVDTLPAFRAGLRDLAPYLVARLAADRADERLASRDARRLRDFVEVFSNQLATLLSGASSTAEILTPVFTARRSGYRRGLARRCRRSSSRVGTLASGSL